MSEGKAFQIIQMAVQLAGFSGPEADLLRVAMGKKFEGTRRSRARGLFEHDMPPRDGLKNSYVFRV